MALKYMELSSDDLRRTMSAWQEEDGSDVFDEYQGGEDETAWIIGQIVEALASELDARPLNGADGGGPRESIGVTYVTGTEGLGVEGLEFSYAIYPPYPLPEGMEGATTLYLGSTFWEVSHMVPEGSGMDGAVQIAHDVQAIVNAAISGFNFWSAR